MSLSCCDPDFQKANRLQYVSKRCQALLGYAAPYGDICALEFGGMGFGGECKVPTEPPLRSQFKHRPAWLPTRSTWWSHSQERYEEGGPTKTWNG
eukprot:90151-Amphidinium_carterae.2